MKNPTALLLALVGLPLAIHAADQPTPESLLAAAKEASGGPAWDKIVTWHEKGTISAGGLTGTYESWIDFPTTHGTGSYNLGPASGGEGWDGTQPWTTDDSKQVRVETSQEAVAGAIQDAYRGSYAFFMPGRVAAQFAYTGTRQADGRTYPAIKVTPQGADPFEIWFDPATHRIAREAQLTGDHPQSYLFSDYASFGGVLIPGKVISRTDNQPKFDMVGKVTSVVLSGPEQTSRYSPPPPPVDTATWPAGVNSVTLPFRLFNNHIYVEASINGFPTTPFVFDTGATNVIDTAAAKTFGVVSQGALPGGGFGDKVPAFGMARIKSVSLGGFSLPNQIFTTYSEPGWVAVEGVKSYGLVGYEFAKRAVVTIDYARHQMTFTKPGAFHPPAGVQSIPFAFDDHTPMIPATLDGVPGEYELDTGARGALTLMIPFAHAHGLVEKYHATITGTTGYGVGGPARALIGRAGKLIIGPVTIEGPVVEIAANKSGGGSETHTAGNMGGDLLKRFTVTLDYGHRLVWLQPNDLASQQEVFDRSGLWIMRAADGGIEVGDVTSSSPAAKLGLVTGDEILTVNGKPAKDIALPDLREEFKSAPGTSFSLALKRPSGLKTVTLILASQV